MFVTLRGVTSTAHLCLGKKIFGKNRASICSKPPKEKIGPVQTFFTMSAFALSLLVPAGWILHHIPEYRSRP
ncbi:cytochrome c oxidase subunit 8A, mitochondrial [Amia ocellicauda]|uniref:cytochrome c oxidase subunit 8A, mitochondrial n=1 Tax=Amia ocellicauda TaxID=2972642 RepID=UPI0034645BE6